MCVQLVQLDIDAIARRLCWGDSVASELSEMRSRILIDRNLVGFCLEASALSLQPRFEVAIDTRVSLLLWVKASPEGTVDT